MMKKNLKYVQTMNDSLNISKKYLQYQKCQKPMPTCITQEQKIPRLQQSCRLFKNFNINIILIRWPNTNLNV